MRIFSGIKPTGDATFGNYSGGFRQYTLTQEQGDAFFCIVDLHAITVEHDPDELRSRTLDLAAMLFATGLDPQRSTVFVQSHVKAHAEAAWLLSAVTSYGQLGRMTQFKEKGDRRDFVSAALFNYPILMAGDILLYEADAVPIGDDQRQHLELARDIAERFNTRFGQTFKVPDGQFPVALLNRNDKLHDRLGDSFLERSVALSVEPRLDVRDRRAGRDRHDLDQVRDPRLPLNVVAHIGT